MNHIAIVLAGGRGSRMQSDTPKQYLTVAGRPLLFYTLQAFEKSSIYGIVLVVPQGGIEYARREIVERFGFTKVLAIVEGGSERFESVGCGLDAIAKLTVPCDYVHVHDGARAFLTPELIERMQQSVEEYRACVAAIPVTDTIKVEDGAGFVASTPNRSLLWSIQTPQSFAYPILREGYDKLREDCERTVTITDDAMIVERYTGQKIKLIPGEVTNCKVTTPEDLRFAEYTISNR